MTPLPPLPDLFGNPILRDWHEILPAASIDWMPQTPGWWLLFVIASYFGIRHLWRKLYRWHKNRYRREALQQLMALSQSNREVSVGTVNALLKLTALAIAPRVEVAPLSGNAWVDWLDAQLGSHRFSSDVRLALSEGPFDPHAPAANAQIFTETRLWIEQHRSPWDA